LERKKGSILIILMVLPMFLAGFASQIRPALALTPSVDAPLVWTSGTHTILNITVRHEIIPAEPSHYVNFVEVDIDGTTHTINLSPPQPDHFFIVQYDMGEVAATPTVKARAHCTIHNFSAYSPSVQVPEFSFAQLLLILVTILGLVVLVRSKVHSLRKKTVKNPKGIALFLGNSKTIRTLSSERF
jgi:hypothetical protein